jgi:hypothetical protein
VSALAIERQVGERGPLLVPRTLGLVDFFLFRGTTFVQLAYPD